MRTGLTLLCLLTLAAPVAAQDPAPADTTRPDSVLRTIHDPRMYAALLGTMAAMAFAPAALAIVATGDSADAPMTPRHATLFATLGYAESAMGDDEVTEHGWTYGYALQVMHGHLVADAWVERHTVSDEVRLSGGRVGYLLRSGPRVAGGVTVGYREASTDDFAKGIEIGFPLVFGVEDGFMRLDAAYVLSHRAGAWSWDFQAAGRIPRTPVMAGATCTLRSPLWGGEVSLGGCAVLLGLRATPAGTPGPPRASPARDPTGPSPR